MKIAVIGMGNVGGTLGTRWASTGHDVVFGVREPASPKVVLATPWESVRDAVAVAGDLRGKVVVDCTNPIAENRSGLTIGLTTSAGEQVAQWATGARVVKAFNTTGSSNMANPEYAEGKVTMFICGDDADAKETVSALATELGFDVCDSGPLQMARYLEPLAMAWIKLAYAQGLGRDIAFRLIKR